MADIATVWDAANGRGDWVLPQPFAFATDANGHPIIGPDGRAVPLAAQGSTAGAGLVASRDLETAVLISLFTDAAAGADDAVPGDDPRGWWGDPTMGSKLWMRMSGKQTPATLLLVRADVQAALKWMLDDGVAASIDVVTQWISRGLLGCQVTLRRTDGTTVALSYEWAWEAR